MGPARKVPKMSHGTLAWPLEIDFEIQLSLRDDIRANSGAVELLIRRMYTSSVVSPFDAQGTVNVDAANNCCGTGFSDLL